MNKKEILGFLHTLEEQEEIEILGEEETHVFIWDGEKESILRFPEKLDKKALLEDIVAVYSPSIDRNKLINLLLTLDDSLFYSLQKIVIFETEEDYQTIMSTYFDNTDMLDMDEELGKYLYFEDWVLINLKLIKETAEQLVSTPEACRLEVNIGFWTTLLHELRHGYQFTVLFQHEMDNVDIEEDAEQYGIAAFEEQILLNDYDVIHE